MTDSQRTKFWRALRSLPYQPLTDDEIRSLVLEITKTAWFRKRAHVNPMMDTAWKVAAVELRHAPNYTQCHCEFFALRKRANAKIQPYSLRLSIGADERAPMFVLHALTHILRPDHDHGPQFTKELLAMTARFLGVDKKKEVQAAYREFKVRFYVYSDDAKAGMRARAQARDLVALREELST